MALLLITHDLGLVEKTADRVYVMQQGQIVEDGDTAVIFKEAKASYTRPDSGRTESDKRKNERRRPGSPQSRTAWRMVSDPAWNPAPNR